MEHSIEKYLERQSTEKLEIALRGVRQDTDTDMNRKLIRMILDILQKRGIEI